MADVNNEQIDSILENLSALSEKVSQSETFMKSMADVPALVQQQAEILAGIAAQMNFGHDDIETEEFGEEQSNTENEEQLGSQAFQTLLREKENLIQKGWFFCSESLYI